MFKKFLSLFAAIVICQSCTKSINDNPQISPVNLDFKTSVNISNSTTSVNLKQGLIAYYPFNGNANDASGNNNPGTVNGAILTKDRFFKKSSNF